MAASKLTPELHKQLVDRVRRGAYFDDAALAVGITDRTLTYWRARGAKGEEPYATLFDDMNVARAEARVTATARLHAAGKDDWRAAESFLEHTDPRWSRRQRVEVTGADGGPIETVSAHDELLARLAGVAAREAPPSGAGGSDPGASGGGGA